MGIRFHRIARIRQTWLAKEFLNNKNEIIRIRRGILNNRPLSLTLNHKSHRLSLPETVDSTYFLDILLTRDSANRTSKEKMPGDLTQLLKECSKGKQEALDELLPAVYAELRRLAGSYLRRERPDHTLQATALVHEAYLKLIDQHSVNWQNRAHFFGVAAQLMRRILVDHARTHLREKRGGQMQRLSLDDAVSWVEERDVDLVALDDALTELAKFDERKSRLVELRFFSGLSIEETAEVLRIAPSTVLRDWSLAKAWLYNQITKQ
jgi:RNA polymerase sigma-70 factor (ECF subfamily)